MKNFDVLKNELNTIANKYGMVMNYNDVEELDMITANGCCSKEAYIEVRSLFIRMGIELCYEKGKEKTRIFPDKELGITICLKENLYKTWGQREYKG
jgi:hypothetical protein